MGAAKHTPEAGDEVYSADGSIALYVARAKGGGHIVQPMLEDSDGVSEPQSYYVDGVDLWPEVYRKPPRPMLDRAIAEQQERLATLKREVTEMERMKREADRDHKALKDRFAMHQALAALDDLLAGRITHYLIDVSENRNGQWKVVPASEFFKLRTHYSIVSLRLWANLNESRASVNWKFSPKGERHDPECRAYAFTSEAEAVAKMHEVVTAELLETARHASSTYWMRQRIKWCTAQGVPVPDEIAQKLAAMERAEAEAAAEKARLDLERAQTALANLAAAKGEA